MSNTQEINSLAHKTVDELSKYTYFLLAASGTSIAYALNQSGNVKPSFILIPFFVSLLSWCGSFYFGIRHLDFIRTHMIENAKSLLANETGLQMMSRLEPFAEKSQSASNFQYWFFLGGVVFYIAWRVCILFNINA